MHKITSPFRAVIFDLDGTLLDTLPDLAAAMNRALRRANLPEHSLTEYYRFVGNGAEELARRAMPENHHADLAPVLTDFMADYQQNWAVKTAPYPGVEAVLTALTARGIILNLLSNKPHRYIPEIMRHFFPHQIFAEASGQHPDQPRKPDPWGALRIAEKLKLAPAQILCIGDSAVDLATAAAARMPFGAVLWGYGDPAALRAATPLAAAAPEKILSWF